VRGCSIYRYEVVGDGICRIMEEDKYQPESDRIFGRRRMGRAGAGGWGEGEGVSMGDEEYEAW
jgi:hypothetical protein